MQILNGDCLELMKTLPDKSIDLFICDLPYGCLSGNAKIDPDFKKLGNSYGHAKCSWDVKIDLNAFWVQVERLMKNDHTPIIQFCNTSFGNDLINSKPSWFRYDLVWSKPSAIGFLNANRQPLRSHELIYVFAKKGATYYRKDIEGDFKNTPKVSNEGKRCVKSVIEMNNRKAKGQHPTAKPIDLYKFLIERYSKEGDTILDPTFGSGNSGIASVELNRMYIGIEKDEKFFNKFAEKQSATEKGS